MSAIFNRAKLEFELDCKNPFAALEIEGLRDDAKDVTPFSDVELATLAKAIMLEKGENTRSRYLSSSMEAGLQFETGMRIGEAVFRPLSR